MTLTQLIERSKTFDDCLAWESSRGKYSSPKFMGGLFVQGARYQHAQTLPIIEMLEKAVSALEDYAGRSLGNGLAETTLKQLEAMSAKESR